MALAHYKTYASGTTGEQASINLDPSINPFSITAAVFLVGTGSYGLEWSFDDYSVSDANARWFLDLLIPVGTVASKYANYNTPATRVRINIASNVGGIEFKVLQAFSIN